MEEDKNFIKNDVNRGKTFRILILIIAIVALVVYFINAFNKGVTLSQIKNFSNVQTIVKNIKDIEKLVIFQVTYEDIIKVNNEKIDQTYNTAFILQEGVYRYSGKALFGIDFREFNQYYIDEKSKKIYLPSVKLLDIEFKSFNAWFEQYAIEQKNNYQTSYTIVSAPTTIKTGVLDMYKYMAEENLKEKALNIYKIRKEEIDNKGLEIFRKFFAPMFGIQGYEIYYKEWCYV